MSKEVKPNRLKDGWNKLVSAVKTIPNVWTNLVTLTEAVSLVVVAGAAYWVTYMHSFSTVWQTYGLRLASVVIALRGATELLKYLSRK